VGWVPLPLARGDSIGKYVEHNGDADRRLHHPHDVVAVALTHELKVGQAREDLFEISGFLDCGLLRKELADVVEEGLFHPLVDEDVLVEGVVLQHRGEFEVEVLDHSPVL